MYEIIKSVIEGGAFKLNDLSNKIDTLWVGGKLTDEERENLISLMSDHLNPATEAPQDYELLARQIADLKETVSSLSDRVAVLEGGETEPEEPTGVVIPAWVSWDGISDNYQYGAVVTHSDKYWQNMLQDVQNTWEPGAVGVDDRYWKEITKEEAEKLVSGQTDR